MKNYQPKLHAPLFLGELPQNLQYHLALFESPEMGSLMIPEKSNGFNDFSNPTGFHAQEKFFALAVANWMKHIIIIN